MIKKKKQFRKEGGGDLFTVDVACTFVVRAQSQVSY